MRCVGLLLTVLSLSGCSWFRDPPTQQITPGSRVIYYGGVAVWSICDRGNLIYMTDKSPQIAVVAGGCPTGSP
jgi:hypothetical protein